MIKAASLFSQLLKYFPKTEFMQLVSKHNAERHAKGFSCWTQLVSMLFCHIAHADSLREICGGLACCLGKLKHLGVARAKAMIKAASLFSQLLKYFPKTLLSKIGNQN